MSVEAKYRLRTTCKGETFRVEEKQRNRQVSRGDPKSHGYSVGSQTPEFVARLAATGAPTIPGSGLSQQAGEDYEKVSHTLGLFRLKHASP
jgi:hypothetical protein